MDSRLCPLGAAQGSIPATAEASGLSLNTSTAQCSVADGLKMGAFCFAFFKRANREQRMKTVKKT